MRLDPPIHPIGAAAPKYDPDEVRGARLHQQMLAVALPKRKQIQGYRTRLLDKYRLTKLAYVLRQRALPARALNFLVYLLERKRVSRVHYFPVYLTIDANNSCNLRCPGCPTGLRHPKGRRRGPADVDFLRSVITQAADRCLQISFYNWGEPLLNKDLYAACRYAADRGLWTTVHSNLSVKIESLAQKVVAAGLCNLVVSCDGATQEVYEKYRVGGNVDLVFANMRAMVDEKRRVGSKFPWITAKFLIFDHNWHEMGLFRERSLEAGADEVLFAPAGMGGIYLTERGGTGKSFDLEKLDWVETPPSEGRVCSEPWDHFVMDHDGATFPCCLPFRDEDLFVTPGQAGRMSIMEMWNHENYVHVREFFLGKPGCHNEGLPGACATCSLPAEFENRRRAVHPSKPSPADPSLDRHG